MRQMDAMFQMPPFGGGMMGLEAGPGAGSQRQRGQGQRDQNQVAMPGMFGGFGSMFTDMRRMMNDMQGQFVSLSLVVFNMGFTSVYQLGCAGQGNGGGENL